MFIIDSMYIFAFITDSMFIIVCVYNICVHVDVHTHVLN